MAFFNTIANIANKVLRFVGDDDYSAGNSYNAVSSPILSFKEEKPIDKFENNSAKSTVEAGIKIQGYMNHILEKCKSAGVNSGDILNRLLEYRCMTKEEYDNNLTPSEKETLWKGFSDVIDSAISVKEKYGVNKSADLKTIMNQMLDVYQTDQSHNNIILAKDVLELTGDINGEIKEKNLKNKSIEEKFGVFGKIYNKLCDKFTAFENKELNGLTGEHKIHKQKMLERIKDKAEKMRILQLNMTQDPKTAYLALMSVSSKQLGWGTQALLDSRVSKAERINVADNIMTFDNQAKMIEAHCQRGDSPTKDVVRSMTTSSVSEKSKDGVIVYSEQYNNARSSGKYASFEENGYYTQMAGGIGAGTILNRNMSEDNKKSFIKEFMANEQTRYGDAEEVKQAINESVREYVTNYTKTHSSAETAELNSFIEKNIKIVEVVLNSLTNKMPAIVKNGRKDGVSQNIKPLNIKNEQKPESVKTTNGIKKTDKTKENTRAVSTDPIKKKYEKYSNTSETSEINNITSKPKRKNADVSEISKNIRSGLPYSVAVEIYPAKEFAMYCISEKVPANIYAHIDNVIRTTKPEELATWNSSIAGYNHIVDVLPTSEAEIYIKNKAMTIGVKVLAEKRVEERKKEEEIKFESGNKYAIS